MFIAINGSPRKSGNCAILLEHALEGLKSQGKEAKLINLYDLNFKGCVSCFACKVKNCKPGCVYKDELSPILKDIESCEGLLLASPIYYMGVTGALHSFLERLLFSYMLYNTNNRWRFPKKIPFSIFYTWGANEQTAVAESRALFFAENSLKNMLGYEALVLNSCESWQFNDYSKYEADIFEPVSRWERRQTVFPEECKKAKEIGIKLANS